MNELAEVELQKKVENLKHHLSKLYGTWDFLNWQLEFENLTPFQRDQVTKLYALSKKSVELVDDVLPLIEKLAETKKHFAQIKYAFEMLLRYSSKKNFILAATRLQKLKKVIEKHEELLGLVGEKQ